jgi:hypothetical protein
VITLEKVGIILDYLYCNMVAIGQYMSKLCSVKGLRTHTHIHTRTYKGHYNNLVALRAEIKKAISFLEVSVKDRCLKRLSGLVLIIYVLAHFYITWHLDEAKDNSLTLTTAIWGLSLV